MYEPGTALCQPVLKGNSLQADAAPGKSAAPAIRPVVAGACRQPRESRVHAQLPAVGKRRPNAHDAPSICTELTRRGHALALHPFLN